MHLAMTELDRFQRVSQLFEEARALPRDERGAFVARACGDDRVLREEVAALLAQHDRDDGALDQPIAAADDAMRRVAAGTVGDTPERIGGYRVVRRLGAGGMGVVWLAEQEHPRREVALKVIRPGLAGRDLLRRFELEATVLGRLAHPGIARIYEAGVHDDGSGARPFFAMEHVDGAPLLDHVKEHAPGVRARLELFEKICDAVQHAHQKGVIHRDLKPGNILVADGQPKVLDFGVARATDADLQATTLGTDVGQLVGTLPYMSPEQIEGRTDRLDTRSDVYALGVILYELLADRLPHDLTDVTIARAARIVSEETPVPLGSIDRAYRGDLSTIVAKALEKDADRRYPSASALAGDVRRHLDHVPIVARPATTMYQLRKFARRNKGLVAGIAAAFVALAAGATAATWSLVRARAAADRTTAINAFMEDVLASADERADVRLVDVLREAGDEVAVRFREHAELEADVRHLLGVSFRQLTLHTDAEEHVRRAYDIRRATLGPGDPETLETGLAFAQVVLNIPRTDDALKIAEGVLTAAPADSGIALRARRMMAKARALQGIYDPVEAELRELRAIALARHGSDHALTVSFGDTLAWLLRLRVQRHETDDPDATRQEAIALMREVLDHRTRTQGEAASGTLWIMNDLAEVLRLAGAIDEAAVLVERVLVLAPPKFGEHHGICTRAANTLSRLRWTQGRYDEAADLRIRAIESQRARVGNRAGVYSKMSDGLAYLHAAGRTEVGAEYARALYTRFSEIIGPDAPLTVRYRAEWAAFLSAGGALEEASTQYDAVIAREASIESETTRKRIDLFYGRHLVRLGRYEEAERRLRASRERPASRFGQAWLTQTTRESMVELYDAWGKPAEAERWR
jgi:non-specific serine/threonine protein kinase/serine/threonine-protein kinase